MSKINSREETLCRCLHYGAYHYGRYHENAKGEPLISIDCEEPTTLSTGVIKDFIEFQCPVYANSAAVYENDRVEILGRGNELVKGVVSYGEFTLFVNRVFTTVIGWYVECAHYQIPISKNLKMIKI